MNAPQIIAFYLPQFHPTPENDTWWGKGFTEWTNVGKAKPLFRGHNQPRVPTELGYYDLRLPIVREQQVQLAKEAGVTGFCYWHYWFGNGKRLLFDVFNEVLNSGHPDFPFCLGWANHSWYSKLWNPDGTSTNKCLMEQTYPGLTDEKLHFDFLLSAFKDERYIKVDGRPLLYIFDPEALPKEYIDNFRKWTKESGFPDIYLVANIQYARINREDLYDKGYDAVNYQRLGGTSSVFLRKIGRTGRGIHKLYQRVKGVLLQQPPFVSDYSKVYEYLITEEDSDEKVIPSLVPQWDHTPRSGWNGTFFINATPQNFYKHCISALQIIKSKQNKILFLKSWNEWGEGNFMEPDLTYGRGFIDALRKAIEETDFNR